MTKTFTFPIGLGLQKIGLPLIVVQLFNNNICLLLDTGSNQNIIDKRIYEIFKDKIQLNDEVKQITTLGEPLINSFEVILPFVFERVEYEEPFVCVENIEGFNAIKEESDIQLHGILGNNFFLKYGWIIDFDKIIIYRNIN